MLLMAHSFKPEARVCFAQAEVLSPKEIRWPYLHGLALVTEDPEVAIRDLRRQRGELGEDRIIPAAEGEQRFAAGGGDAEGTGEDAFLGSALARVYFRGFQDDRLDDPYSVAASVKHYDTCGAGRDYKTADMCDSRLRQVYLPPTKQLWRPGRRPL